jgi:hypothetical protein
MLNLNASTIQSGPPAPYLVPPQRSANPDQSEILKLSVNRLFFLETVSVLAPPRSSNAGPRQIAVPPRIILIAIM